MRPETFSVHASCVIIDNQAILILGESGSGKSDLALRLIDSGAMLVSDDQVRIEKNGTSLFASPAPNIAGLLEARGVGIIKLPYVSNAVVALAIKLVTPEKIERLPEAQFFDCLGVKVPLLLLGAFEQSTPAKIRLYLTMKESIA